MAESRPLKENADLRRRFGITMTSKHRETLQRLGLIESSKNPFIHRLTQRGWEWAEEQTRSPRPNGTTGQGALYAVLDALGRYTLSNGLTLQQIFLPAKNGSQATSIRESDAANSAANSSLLPSGRTQIQMLKDAELAEVDEALALLLQDQPVVDRAFLRLDKKAGTALQSEIDGVKNAVNLILQWGRRAASKRSIVRVGDQGQEVDFDPLLYESDEPTPAGSRVLVQRTPVVRKTSLGESVITRGRASAV